MIRFLVHNCFNLKPSLQTHPAQQVVVTQRQLVVAAKVSALCKLCNTSSFFCFLMPMYLVALIIFSKLNVRESACLPLINCIICRNNLHVLPPLCVCVCLLLCVQYGVCPSVHPYVSPKVRRAGKKKNRPVYLSILARLL